MADETELGAVIERLDQLATVLGTKGIETAKNAGEVQDPMSVHVMNVMINEHTLAYNQSLADQQAKNIIQNAQLAGLVAPEST
jgi:hypothetical protein